MALTFVAAYDVSDDGRRAKVAAVLQAWGDRIQYSVFLVTISPEDLPDLRARVAGILSPEHDSFYLIRQCQACWDGLDCIGQAHAPSEALYWAVL